MEHGRQLFFRHCGDRPERRGQCGGPCAPRPVLQHGRICPPRGQQWASWGLRELVAGRSTGEKGARLGKGARGPGGRPQVFADDCWWCEHGRPRAQSLRLQPPGLPAGCLTSVTASRDPREAPEYLGCSGSRLTSLATALRRSALAHGAAHLPGQTPRGVHDDQHPGKMTERGKKQLDAWALVPLTVPDRARGRPPGPALLRRCPLAPRGRRARTSPCVYPRERFHRCTSRRGRNGGFCGTFHALMAHDRSY